MNQQRTEPKVETMEEAIAYAKTHNRWFRVCLAAITCSTLLGLVSTIIYGREFETSDPFIGPLLLPLAYCWCVACMYVFYVIIEVRLSRFTKWLYGFFCIAMCLFLGKFFVVDSLMRYFND